MQEFLDTYHLNNQTIAVGVSGGADSLALVLRLHQAGAKLVALTVDHDLRAESRQEAEYVASLMQQFAIEHHILKWVGAKPHTGVEEAARQARYDLLFAFCHQHHIKYLATGHHRRDQAETFLLRLARGSGVFGLSGILPITERDGITIIRPQLNDSPDDLKKFLQQQNISWVEDPMNAEPDYARVKIRQFLPMLRDVGIDEQRLAETAAILRQTREYLQNCVDDFISANVRRFADVVVAVSLAKLSGLPVEIARLVLGELIRRIGGDSYTPEAASLNRIISEGLDFSGCTLGGCELEVAQSKLWIMPQDKHNRLMTASQWNDFCANHREFANSGLPYKVRRAIWINYNDRK